MLSSTASLTYSLVHFTPIGNKCFSTASWTTRALSSFQALAVSLKLSDANASFNWFWKFCLTSLGKNMVTVIRCWDSAAKMWRNCVFSNIVEIGLLNRYLKLYNNLDLLSSGLCDLVLQTYVVYMIFVDFVLASFCWLDRYERTVFEELPDLLTQ